MSAHAKNEAFVANQISEFIGVDITDERDMEHEEAEERCFHCAWNTTVSDEPSVTKHYYEQIAEDDEVKLDTIYSACPWCEENIDEKEWVVK